ncbi:unnamed protein product [Owenia fusiformis]|uniref:Uncharacterized protein n=1 Tax=Owenia fusiformis TaxID=6347 RepID=A0A8S4NRD9_OWEFU|nr:unnamed protein product [Owenia fusiformis]
MKRIVNEFTSNTSGHGWGMVGCTNSKLGKLLWVAITLGSTIAAIIWVLTIVQTYAKFETKDRVELRADEDIVFQSVTVCLLYGFSPKKIRATLTDPNSGYVLQNSFLKTIYTNHVVLTQMTNESILENIVGQARTNRGYYENLGPSEISSLGHNIGSLIPYCMYQESKCTEADFRKLVHHEYKNCYTFNGEDVNLTKPIITEVGAQSGLSFTLYLDHKEGARVTYEKSRAMTVASGARVIIHEKGTLPDPDSKGFDVEPGHLINVALSVDKRELMKPPWGECADHTTLHSTDFKYTRNTCKRKCMEKMIEKQCGCWKDLLPVDLNDTRDDDLQACGKMNREEWLKTTRANVTVLKEDIARIKCQNEKYSWSEVSEAVVGCECKLNCTYLSYNIETSQSVWPMKGSELDFYCIGFSYDTGYNGSSIYDEFHDKIGVHCSDHFEFENVSKNWGDELRANFLRINVYFKDTETKYIIEEENFPLVSMISEIGGVLGLFIGVSLITILEVFVLCSSIIYTLLGRKKMSNEIHEKENMSVSKTNIEKLSDCKIADYQNNQFK